MSRVSRLVLLGSRHKRRPSPPLGLLAIIALLICGAIPAAANAQTLPASLAGETLVDSVFDPDSQVAGQCNPEGTSTLSYRLENGVATGPYPGTFDEQGTVTIGPQNGDPGPIGLNQSPTGVAVIRASFTIDSPLGQVTGQKETTATLRSGGVCREFEFFGENGGRNVGYEFAAFGPLEYQATIKTPEGGTFRDSGLSYVNLFKGNNVGTPPAVSDNGLFVEDFLSSRGVERLLPTAKEQCLNGGFKNFPGFGNQGDCVAFVATEGKNELGKNVPGLP